MPDRHSKPYRKHVGDAIRLLRQARGMVQEDFSDITSRTYFSDVERGVKSPTVDKVAEYADRLGVQPSTISTLADALAAGEGTEAVLVAARNQLPR